MKKILHVIDDKGVNFMNKVKIENYARVNVEVKNIFEALKFEAFGHSGVEIPKNQI